MFRILLIIAVIAIGYDAVVHQGHYTRNVWTSVVGLTEFRRHQRQAAQRTRAPGQPLARHPLADQLMSFGASASYRSQPIETCRSAANSSGQRVAMPRHSQCRNSQDFDA